MRSRPPRAHALLGLILLLPMAGCATLQQLTALRSVDFALHQVSGLRLAGVDLGSVRSFQDLTASDAGRLLLAVSQREIPLEFRLHLLAENPADNDVQARLMQMDWTLLVQERETLSGVLEREVLLPPGQPTDIPLAIRMDLLEFFEGGAQDLLELALSVAGQGGAPKEVALRVHPTIQTPLGPMRYPRPITLEGGEVGPPTWPG